MSIEERLEMLTTTTQELHARLQVEEQRGTEQQARAETAEQTATSAERRAGDQQPRVVWSTRAMDNMQLGPIPNNYMPTTDPEHGQHHPHSRQLYLALALQFGDGSDAQ
eukprot:5270913-Amphidinium_carterae.2